MNEEEEDRGFVAAYGDALASNDLAATIGILALRLDRLQARVVEAKARADDAEAELEFYRALASVYESTLRSVLAATER